MLPWKTQINNFFCSTYKSNQIAVHVRIWDVKSGLDLVFCLKSVSWLDGSRDGNLGVYFLHLEKTTSWAVSNS